MKIIIAGIGTEVGKTVVSAIFCEAFQLDYWKPIQSGSEDDNDTETVKNLISKEITIYPNTYCLQKPLSPDQAAKLEGISINPDNIVMPDSSRLLIEPAGGLMVPLTSDGYLFSDKLIEWNLPVFLISRFYLGSINHTLLSIEFLKSNNLNLAGIIFTGEMNYESAEIIKRKSPLAPTFHIPWSNQLNKSFVKEQAKKLKETRISQNFK